MLLLVFICSFRSMYIHKILGDPNCTKFLHVTNPSFGFTFDFLWFYTENWISFVWLVTILEI